MDLDDAIGQYHIKILVDVRSCPDTRKVNCPISTSNNKPNPKPEFLTLIPDPNPKPKRQSLNPNPNPKLNH